MQDDISKHYTSSVLIQWSENTSNRNSFLKHLLPSKAWFPPVSDTPHLLQNTAHRSAPAGSIAHWQGETASRGGTQQGQKQQCDPPSTKAYANQLSASIISFMET